MCWSSTSSKSDYGTLRILFQEGCSKNYIHVIFWVAAFDFVKTAIHCILAMPLTRGFLRRSYAKKSVSENGLCFHHSCNYRSCLCFLQHLCCKWRFTSTGCGNNQCPYSCKNNRRNLHVQPHYAGLVCSSGWILFCLLYPAVFYSALCANYLQTVFCKDRDPVAIAMKLTRWVSRRVSFEAVLRVRY